jgi:hypothetical protein
MLIFNNTEGGEIVIREYGLGNDRAEIWIRFCYITEKKESMKTGTRSGLIPIRRANPHGIGLTAVPSASHRK